MKKSLLCSFGLMTFATGLYAEYNEGKLPEFQLQRKVQPIFLIPLPILEELMRPNFYHVSYL